jgi:hypothetical protein
MVVRPLVTLSPPWGREAATSCFGGATPVQRMSRPGILEDGSRPIRGRLTTSSKGSLQVSDV